MTLQPTPSGYPASFVTATSPGPLITTATNYAGIPTTTGYPGHSYYPIHGSTVTSTIGRGTHPINIPQITVGTTYPTATSYRCATNYYPISHEQSIAGARIYCPPNTEYVPPNSPLRGGMYTIYDSAAVPTFEAPIVFSTVGGAESRSPMLPADNANLEVSGRDAGSNHVVSRVRLPKRTINRKKGCCAC